MEAISLEQYTQRGWSVIPLKGKAPACQNGFKDGTVDMTQIQGWLDKRHKNFGIVTGKASGIVVLDIDPRNGGDKSLQTLVETMGPLPKTPRVQTGGGGWHYYFKYPDSAEIRCRRNLYAGIDLKADGGYVVAPPSIHPDSDQAYQWEIHPEDVELAELPEWLLLELCPQLETLCDATSNMDIVFTAKPDQADSFITECNQFLETLDLSKIYGPWLTGKKSGNGDFWLECRDPESPTGDRNPSAGVCLGTESITKGTFHSFRSEKTQFIWDFMVKNKISPNQKEALLYLAILTRSQIPRQLRERYVDDAGETIIEEFNQKYAVVGIGNFYRIMDESVVPVKYLQIPDFRLKEQNRFIFIEGKKKCAPDYWLDHPKRRTFNNVVFEPKGCPIDCYNLWRGFYVQPKPGDCSLFLEFVRDIVCSGNAEYYDYLVSWMAQAVQYPEIKPGVAIVLKGGQGVGKGFFVNTFGYLFGNHYVTSAKNDDFVGKFNGILEGKLVVFMDECFWAGDKTTASKLKALITEPRITIERKGVDQFFTSNYLRILIASNDQWIIKAEKDDRRYFVLEVSNAQQTKKEYFNKIAFQMENGGYEALHYELRNRDISGIDIGNFPKTTYHIDQKLASLDPLERFWYERLRDGTLQPDQYSWPEKIEKKVFYDFYVLAMKKFFVGDAIFSKQLKKMCPSLGSTKGKNDFGQRKSAYILPSLEICRQSFEEYLHSVGLIDWDQ